MTGDTVTSVGVSREGASMAAVEAAADAVPSVDTIVAEDIVREALIVDTCHRVEVYVVTATPRAGQAVVEALDLPGGTIRDHEDSLRHLLRVAAGLESMVLGEDQVLGQVRSAYETARTADAIGPVLEDAVTKAIHVGERARTETAINEGVVSLGSAAVRLAERHIDLDGATALVIGAGEMGELSATAFNEVVDRIIIANRTVERAEAVASSLDAKAEACGLDRLADHLGAADVAVSATHSTQPVIGAEDANQAGETLVVDLGRPADVAPPAAATDGFHVVDYAALESVTERTHERRRAAAQRVEAIVEEEFDRLLQGFKRKQADEVIAAMYESAEGIKRREIEEALGRLEGEDELSQEQREIVESMAEALVSKLLAAPTRSLRDAAAADDWSTISTALALFDPHFAEQPNGLSLPNTEDEAVVVPEEYPDDIDVPSRND